MDQPPNPWQVHSKWAPISREDITLVFSLEKGRSDLLDSDRTKARRIWWNGRRTQFVCRSSGRWARRDRCRLWEVQGWKWIPVRGEEAFRRLGLSQALGPLYFKSIKVINEVIWELEEEEDFREYRTLKTKHVRKKSDMSRIIDGITIVNF